MTRLAKMTVVGLASLFIGVGVAGASHQENGQGDSRDFAVGGGTSGDGNGPGGDQTVGFAAHGGPSPSGDPVTGHFKAGGTFLVDDQLTRFNQEGPVTCLVVQENEARLFYPVKQSKPDQPNESTGVLIFLRDNGDPSKGDPRDQIGFAILPDEDPDRPGEQDAACVAPLVTPALDDLEKGNFTIHDADPTDTPLSPTASPTNRTDGDGGTGLSDELPSASDDVSGGPDDLTGEQPEGANDLPDVVPSLP